MDPEIIAILAVGVGLAGLILNGQRSLKQEFRREIASVRQEIASLRQEIQNEIALLRKEVSDLNGRVARLEGGFPFIANHLKPASEKDQ